MTDDWRVERALRTRVSLLERKLRFLAAAVAAHRAHVMHEDSDDVSQHQADLALWHAAQRIVGEIDGVD